MEDWAGSASVRGNDDEIGLAIAPNATIVQEMWRNMMHHYDKLYDTRLPKDQRVHYGDQILSI